VVVKMEMMTFLFNDNLGIDYNNKADYRLIKTAECLLKLKETMLQWVEDKTFEMQQTKYNQKIERLINEVKTINKVYNYILDEMDDRSGSFTFDDVVNYRYAMNKVNKKFYDVVKAK
jgi:hypothetical protein